MQKRIRVLVADDSATVRAALTSILADDARIEVVGEAVDGVDALARAKALQPDVITMDVRMPRLNGLEATAAIMATQPSRILVVCGVTDEEHKDLTFRAMAAGALELIAKPATPSLADLRAWGRRVAEAVCLMAEVPVVTRRRAQLEPPASPSQPRPGARSGHLDAFAIVASTGGPPALAEILGALPRELPVPLFVAQHMADGFMTGLLRWLRTVTTMNVTVAEPGTAARPGHVYFPPDGHDLTVAPGGLLRVAKSPGGHCPSGDRLLHSIAKAYGGRSGAAVLTGMGEDGAQGLLAIRTAGGATFAQDAQSCVVFGMPDAAQRIGAAQAMVPLRSVAGVIRDLCLPLGRDA